MRNLPIDLAFSTEPSERRVVVERLFVTRNGLSFPDRTLIQFALNEHFGGVARPQGFLRVIGFARDATLPIQIAAFEAANPVPANGSPEEEFIAAIGSRIDVVEGRATELFSPTLFRLSDSPDQVAEFAEGAQVDLLQNVNVANKQAGLKLRISHGDELLGVIDIQAFGSEAGQFLHRFEQSNETTATDRIMLELLGDDNVLDALDTPIRVTNVNPTLSVIDAANTIQPLAFNDITFDVHPLQIDEDRFGQVHLVRVRPATEFSRISRRWEPSCLSEKPIRTRAS